MTNCDGGIVAGNVPDFKSSSGTTVSGSSSGSDSEERQDEEDEGNSGPSCELEDIVQEKGKGENTRKLEVEKRFREGGLVNPPVQQLRAHDLEGVDIPRANVPTVDVDEVQGAGCQEVREPGGEKRESDMELHSEIKGEVETKGKAGGVVEVVKLQGIEERLDEGQEVELEHESLDHDKDCPPQGKPLTSESQHIRGGLEGLSMKKMLEGDEGATTVEVHREVKHHRGKRKSEEGRRLQEELEGQNMARVVAMDQGRAQRTRASRRSTDAGDDKHLREGVEQTSYQTHKTKKQKKDNAMERVGEKKSSKRKKKETPTLRSVPDIASPGGSPSGKKLKPMKFVLESSN